MIKVLLVDDEPALLDIGKIFIEKTGLFEVETASCADEALEMLEVAEDASFDALISDYEMPGKNGIEFLRVLRSQENNIPFLIFTGKGREDVVIEAIESGADYYVQKGGSPGPQFADLTDKIKKAVDKRKSDENLRETNSRLAAACSQLKASEEMAKDQLRMLRESEKKLRMSEESLSLAVEGGELGIWDSDIETHRQTVNEIWAEMLGYTREEVDDVPDFWREHVHPDDLPEVLKGVDDCVSGRCEEYYSEFRMRCKDKSWKWIASTGKVSACDQKGKPVRISGVHRDITELISTGKSLGTARKKVNLLSKMAGYCLLDQIKTIGTNAELLRCSLSGGSRQQGYVSAIQKSAEDMEKQIDLLAGYMDMSLKEPVWQNAGDLITCTSDDFPVLAHEYDRTLSGLEVYSVPVFNKLLYKITENLTALIKSQESCGSIRTGFEEKNGFGVISVEGRGCTVPDILDKSDLCGSFSERNDVEMRIIKDILSLSGIEAVEISSPGIPLKFEIRIPAELYSLNES